MRGRDRGFADAYNAAKIGYHAEFALLVDDILRRHDLAPALPSLQIAIGLYALWSGLAVLGTVPGARPRDEIFLAFLRAVIGESPSNSVTASMSTGQSVLIVLLPAYGEQHRRHEVLKQAVRIN